MTTIGPNPTVIELDVPKARQMNVDESRKDYIGNIVMRVARNTLNRLLEHPEYKYAHKSFAVRDAMLVAEAACPDVGTFGVEFVNSGTNQRSPEFYYLNTGDPYETTLLYINGRFRVGCWGDIVERGNYP